MKITPLLILGLSFFIVVNFSFAACQTLDDIMAEYHNCLAGCDGISDSIQKYNCVNVCIGNWSKANDRYYKCLADEREQARQKKLEEQKLLEQQQAAEKQKQQEEQAREQEQNVLSPEVTYQTYHETGYTINMHKGEVEITRNGVIFPINSDFKVFPGDAIRTGGDGMIELTSDDSTIKLGEDTLAKMLGIDPANSRVISSPAWDEDPNYKREMDHWEFWENIFVDLADFINENRPDYLLDCADGDIKGCVWGTVKFIHDGVGWFNEKIDKDFKKRMVVTPTAVITPDGTEFIVEVALDGATTVTTLNGTIIVMDLTSRKSVIVEVNQKLTIPNTSTGLGEQELQQGLTEIDPKSIDKWWIKAEDTPKNGVLIFCIIILIGIAIGITTFLIKKHTKSKTEV